MEDFLITFLLWIWIVIGVLTFAFSCINYLGDELPPGSYKSWSKIIANTVFWPIYFVKMLWDGVFNR